MLVLLFILFVLFQGPYELQGRRFGPSFSSSTQVTRFLTHVDQVLCSTLRKAIFPAFKKHRWMSYTCGKCDGEYLSFDFAQPNHLLEDCF